MPATCVDDGKVGGGRRHFFGLDEDLKESGLDR
jgi:hypothetical protein